MNITLEHALVFAETWCQQHGYPGGEVALTRKGLRELFKGTTLADLERRRFGNHECSYNCGEFYPEHCVICKVAVNDPRRTQQSPRLTPEPPAP